MNSGGAAGVVHIAPEDQNEPVGEQQAGGNAGNERAVGPSTSRRGCAQSTRRGAEGRAERGLISA
jgi:hypothetical protein